MQSRNGVLPTPRPLIRRMALHTNSDMLRFALPIIPSAALDSKGTGIGFLQDVPKVWDKNRTFGVFVCLADWSGGGLLAPPGPVCENSK